MLNLEAVTLLVSGETRSLAATKTSESVHHFYVNYLIASAFHTDKAVQYHIEILLEDEIRKFYD
jgi:hypothetical protein